MPEREAGEPERSTPEAPETPAAGGESGLAIPSSAAPWSAAHRAELLERLGRDGRRREELAVRQRRALDGIRHALDPGSMDPSIPPRLLVEYDLDSPDGPAAAIAVGEPEGATHMTWQISGMGIAAHTAAWGSAHEAGQLHLAQRAAGAPRPCVVAWLGHRPPTWWRVLGDAAGRQAGGHLAEHLEAWHAAHTGAGPGPAPHLALEAHSYGTLVAAHALVALASRASGRRVDVLVVAGAVGLPRALSRRLRESGAQPPRLFEARAPGDVLAFLGRRLAARTRWRDAVVVPVGADSAAGLAAVRGHNTSQWLPEHGEDAARGYRDPGSATLAAVARATTGLPLAPGA